MAAIWRPSLVLGSTPSQPHQAGQTRRQKGERAGLGHGRDRQSTEEAVFLTVYAGGEIDGVGIDPGAAIANAWAFEEIQWLKENN